MNMIDKIKIVTKPEFEPRAVAKRMLFLAYEASSVVGMGILQARGGVTEEQFATNAYHEEGRNLSDPERSMLASYCVDYGFGRMMKLHVHYDQDGVVVSTIAPRNDYQSWSNTYSTYSSLANAALASMRKS